MNWLTHIKGHPIINYLYFNLKKKELNTAANPLNGAGVQDAILSQGKTATESITFF